MGFKDWKYDFEPEILEWLENRGFGHHCDLMGEIDDLKGPEIEDTLDLMEFRFKLSRPECLLRLQAWHEYLQYGDIFPCENCGAEINLGQSCHSHGCSCGTLYVSDGPGKWHIDPGTVTYENGVKIITHKFE